MGIETDRLYRESQLTSEGLEKKGLADDGLSGAQIFRKSSREYFLAYENGNGWWKIISHCKSKKPIKPMPYIGPTIEQKVDQIIEIGEEPTWE